MVNALKSCEWPKHNYIPWMFDFIGEILDSEYPVGCELDHKFLKNQEQQWIINPGYQ